MKNCLHAFSTWIICLLALGFATAMQAQNVREGFCDYSVEVTCGVAITNQTTVGGPNVISAYPQCNHYTFAGPEKVYRFTTSANGTIQVDLSIHTSYVDLDILLMTDDCATPTCLAHSITSNANGKTEQIVYENAPAGTYYVIVDSERDVGAFDLLVTCSPTTSDCNLEYTVTANHISCGGSKGSIDVDISWGKGPFKIEWDNEGNTIWNAVTTNDKKYVITDLPAGTYVVKVTDLGATNCVVMKNGIKISNTGDELNATFSATDAACGTYFGFINIDVVNSSPPYWVTVSGAVSGTAQANSDEIVIKDIPPGNYEVSVEKGNCVKTGWVTVGKKPDLDWVAEVTDASCGDKGSLWVSVSGGSPTYTIEWWHKDGTSDWLQAYAHNFSIDNLKEGEYTIRITDRHGCGKSKKVTIGGGADLDFELESNPASCSSKGSVWVTIKNGTPTYTVEWSGPSGSNWIQTNKTSFAIEDLKAGQYTIVITDKNGCENTKYITVENEGGLLDFDLEANATSCESKGSIWVTINNGHPTYTVEWWGPNLSKWGQTQGNSFPLNDLHAGEYTVKITDKNGCSNTKSIWINDSGSGLDFVLETQDVSCSSSGSIWITLKNGTADYSVDITGDNGVTRWFSAKEKNIQITDLPTGYYTIEITDAKGCKGVKSIRIENKGGKLHYEFETNNADCDNLGSVWITVKDGTPKYYVELWGPNNTYFNGQTSSNSFQLREMEAGSYTLKITDDNGCSDTKVLYIGGGNSDLSLELEANNAGCTYDGKIWVTINGGEGPFHLSWEGPVWGNISVSNRGYQILNLKPGAYTVSVKDSKGCTFTKELIIYDQGSDLKLELEANNGDCGQNGSVWVTIDGGGGPYHISWSGPKEGEASSNNNGYQIGNLPSGWYQVRVKDKNGCSITKEVKIQGGTALSVELSQVETDCGGSGEIWVDINGGISPYQITLDGPMFGSTSTNDNTYHFVNVPRGVYTISIEDGAGCEISKQMEVTSKESDLTLDIETNNANCTEDGSAWIEISGGTPSYTLSWEGPKSGASASSSGSVQLKDLPAGNYEIKATDSKGCSTSKSITINDTGNSPALSLEANNASCGQKGAIWVSVQEGVPAYSISWEGPVSGSANTSQISYKIENLPPGDYAVTLLDNNGCADKEYITVQESEDNLELIVEANPANCEQRGAIWVQIKNGEPEYAISWEGPVSGSTQTSNSSYQIADLPGGYYTVRLKDQLGCEREVSVKVDSKGGDLSVSLSTSTAVFCEHEGSVTISISGGTAPYSISYNGAKSGSATTGSNSFVVDSLDPGDYVFYITDDHGCSASQKITVFDNGSDLSLSLTPTDGECGGKGMIRVDISGGIPNYQITFYGGGINNTLTISNNSFVLTDLPAGFYTVKVTDGIGCTEELSAYVGSAGGDVSIQLNPKNEVCGQGGSIEVKISGGRADYQIQWSGPSDGSAQTGSATYRIENLESGNYNVTVTDANGCQSKEWVAVNKGGEVSYNLSIEDVSCTKDGYILVNISSGSPNYEIYWSGPVSGSKTISTNIYRIDNLSKGTYEITVKDARGCTLTQSVAVGSSGSDLSLSLTNTNTTCGEPNGTITATVAGGSGDYTFTWDGPVNGSEQLSDNSYTIRDLPKGSYIVYVIDSEGCATNKSIEVKEGGNNLGLSAVGTNAACGQPSSIQVTISYGVPPFDIVWSGPADGSIQTDNNSHTITDLADGDYIVRVTDANSCTKAQSVIIKSARNDVNFTYESRAAGCNSTGSIWITIVSGDGPYQISWEGHSAGSSTSSDEGVQITDLNPGVYQVTVKDKNGCVITQTIEVKSSGEGGTVNFAHKPGPVTCNEPGSIFVTMISGVAPYTVSWTGPVSGSRTVSSTDIRIEDLPEGVYEMTVTGAGGCGSRTQEVVIENKQTVLAVEGSVFDGVCGGKGSVDLSWTGGRDPFTISWTGPSTGTIAVNGQSYTVSDLKHGDYTFRVEGYDGCEGEFQATVDNSGTASIADFSYGVSGKTLTFSNLSTNGTYSWNFGDGNVSEEVNPTHTYELNGTYTICLKVSNDCGADEHCLGITINGVSDEEASKVLLGERAGIKGTVVQLPVRVDNCSRLATLSGSIILSNKSAAKVNGISPSAISPVYNDANYSFSYLSPGLGMSINSETILFYINVELIGSSGQSSSIDLTSLPVALELTCTQDGISDPITPEVGGGRVTISKEQLMTDVTGNIYTYWGEGVANAMVAIQSADHEVFPMTSVEGIYNADEVPMGYEYEIRPYKNSNPSNGLSTLGLFLTQKYILGYQPEEIESPYQVIAMDANCSGTLTTFDLYVMQQMLVGNLTEFPNCNSWVFVDAAHEFPVEFDSKNVFPYASSHNMMLEEEAAVVDFIGVKVGDVLGRAIPNDGYQSPVAEDRNRRVVPLRFADRLVEKGQEFEVSFHSEAFTAVSDFQLGLDFDPEQLEFIGFERNEKNSLSSAVAGVNANQIRISWYHPEGRSQTTEKSETIFTLKFKAKEKIDNIVEVLQVNNRTFSSVLHKQTKEPYQFELLNTIPNKEAGFKVYQNTPNPFLEATSILIEMPQSGAVEIFIQDQFGRVLLSYDRLLKKGVNSVRINRNHLSAGIYYYTVKSGELTETRRLLIVDH